MRRLEPDQLTRADAYKTQPSILNIMFANSGLAHGKRAQARAAEEEIPSLTVDVEEPRTAGVAEEEPQSWGGLFMEWALE